jgi:hypothetical protein
MLGSGSAVMEIRTFAETDRADLRELFSRAGEGAPSASVWGHEESEAAIYLYPYMDLEPDSLFVAVVDGALVGYLAGCLDSSRFPSESVRDASSWRSLLASGVQTDGVVVEVPDRRDRPDVVEQRRRHDDLAPSDSCALKRRFDALARQIDHCPQ